MPDPKDHLSNPPEDDAHDEAVGRLINEFFDRKESGENLTEDTFISENPEYAEDLRDHLGGLNLLKGVGGSSGRDALNNDTMPAELGRRNNEDLKSIPLPNIPGYEVQRAIGRGGMGIVFKAVQTNTRRQVALKVLLDGAFATAQTKKRFEREISLSAQLRHPNIIPIYDSGIFDGRMYYAMEYVRGMPLDEWSKKTNPTINQKILLFVKVCEAMRHAHQRGVIHRDMKPTNILVKSDGEPHLLDFGLAKQGTYGDMTTSITAQIIGTPAYMSPEQAAGDPTGIDVRTDVYSLGVVLFELLTGTMPYATNVSIGDLLNNIARVEPDESKLTQAQIDADLSAIVIKSLEKRQEERYQSVDALMGDLTRYLNDEPISVRPASGIYLLGKALKKHRRIAAIIGLALIPLGMSVYGVTYFNKQWQEKEERIQQKETQIADAAKRVEELEKRQQDLQSQLDQMRLDAQTLEVVKGLFPKETSDYIERLAMSGTKGVPMEVPETLQKSFMALLPQPSENEKAPSKDLTGGTTDIPIFNFLPDALSPVQEQEKTKSALAWTEYLRIGLQGLSEQQLKELKEAAAAAESAAKTPTTQPTTQPADDPANDEDEIASDSPVGADDKS